MKLEVIGIAKWHPQTMLDRIIQNPALHTSLGHTARSRFVRVRVKLEPNSWQTVRAPVPGSNLISVVSDPRLE